MKFNQLSAPERNRFFKQSDYLKIDRKFYFESAKSLNPIMEKFKGEYFFDEDVEEFITENAFMLYYKANPLKLKDGVHYAKHNGGLIIFKNKEERYHSNTIRGISDVICTVKNGVILKIDDVSIPIRESRKNKEGSGSVAFALLLLVFLIICCCFAYHAAYGKEPQKPLKRNEYSPAATNYKAVNLK